MTDLSKISTDELPIMKLNALRYSLLYLSMAKTSYKVADNIDAEIERRKLNRPLEPTLSKGADK